MRVLALFFILFSSSLFANPNTTFNFSPYDDMTLNATWSQQYQDMEPQDLTTISQSSGVQNFRLAFITDAGNCTPAWGGYTEYAVQNAWGAHMTSKMTTNKIPFVVSFGGASGNDLSAACTVPQLIDAYQTTISTYQPAGLDFDIENGTANVPNIMTALQTIQKNNPNLKISFTLPVLPTGLVSAGESVISNAVNDNLKFTVNIMAMDYGNGFPGDMADLGIQAATNVKQYLQTLYPSLSEAALWQMISIQPMIGVNDVSSEQFTLADAATMKTFAVANNLAGLSMWDIDRDYPCAGQWASTSCSGNNLQSQAFQYSQTFLK